MRFPILLLVVLSVAETAWALPAQNGLTGFLEMRSPEIEQKAMAFTTLHGSSNVGNAGNRFALGLGYQQNWTERAEWGVILPFAVSDPGLGTLQTTLLGKYQWFNAEYFLVATTAYLLLPASIGIAEHGSGDLGAGAEVEIAFKQENVQAGLSVGTERADYCIGCRRLGFTKSGRAVQGVDTAIGLSVPIEQHAVIAEVHHTWAARGATLKAPKVDDAGGYALLGGRVKITEEWAGGLFAGAGFDLGGRKNTELFGGLTAAYTF